MLAGRLFGRTFPDIAKIMNIVFATERTKDQVGAQFSAIRSKHPKKNIIDQIVKSGNSQAIKTEDSKVKKEENGSSSTKLKKRQRQEANGQAGDEDNGDKSAKKTKQNLKVEEQDAKSDHDVTHTNPKPKKKAKTGPKQTKKSRNGKSKKVSATPHTNTDDDSACGAVSNNGDIEKGEESDRPKRAAAVKSEENTRDLYAESIGEDEGGREDTE